MVEDDELANLKKNMLEEMKNRHQENIQPKIKILNSGTRPKPKISFINWLISLVKKTPSTVEVSKNQSIVELNKTKRELEEKQKTISELEKLIEEQQGIIKKQEEHSEVALIPNKEQEEIIERLNLVIDSYQEIIRTYEESANKPNAELEEIRLLYQNEKVKSQEENENKTSQIHELEKSVKTLKNNFKEISNRYHEVNEKYEIEKENAIRLEMLILDLDKILGLIDIAENIKPKEDETIGLMIIKSI
ncbi:MAG: hypothetical protein WC556_11595 [Candidatus Methanoperedens sp.]